MKKIFALIISVALATMAVSTSFAADARPTVAKVIRVTGAAKVQLPDQSATVTIYDGMSLPMGSTIITGGGSTVQLQPTEGGLTTVSQNTTVVLEELSVDMDTNGAVTKQTATLNLRIGNLVSSLDPARKAINNYSVRTPKGVAGARGTVFSVTVSMTATSIATMSGTVIFTPAGGGEPIVVDIGTGLIIGADGTITSTSLASLVEAEAAAGTANAEGSITQMIADAVLMMAAAFVDNTLSDVDADTAFGMLAAVVKVAYDAFPGEPKPAFFAAALATISGSTALSDADRAKGEALFAALESGDPEVFTTPLTPVDATVVSPSGG